MTEPSNSPGASTEELEELRFRQEVQRRRAEKGWSQEALAKKMYDAGWTDFHQATISRIEKGKRPVRLGEARTLARILESSVGAMLAPSTDMQLLETFNRVGQEAVDTMNDAVESMMEFLQYQWALEFQLTQVETVDLEGSVPEDQVDSFQAMINKGRDLVRLDPEVIIEMARQNVGPRSRDTKRA
ncbi:helix-turn-helix transcriptional regulator [Rothia uropygioeca]|uniref:helix-turn-helix transcriptional regulator n=1 Tax=Kocuria sp. 257 TaxID=2021970 RepID=UPI0010121C0A|nr:helix-turn-helix transcriptional regulator [Kocuria sp. 257]